MTYNPWRSERLIYRAVEPEDDTFFQSSTDVVGWSNAAAFLPVPQGKKDFESHRKYLMEQNLLGVMICLPSPTLAEGAAITADSSKPIPIGYIGLSKNPENMQHHHYTGIGLSLAAPYRGQGYGTEAIKFALEFAFKHANMHRVEIGGFEYNARALALYRRMGFVEEGRKRKVFWHDGDYHDLVELGMLKEEWLELFGKK